MDALLTLKPTIVEIKESYIWIQNYRAWVESCQNKKDLINKILN
jgi:hypothetical protein